MRSKYLLIPSLLLFTFSIYAQELRVAPTIVNTQARLVVKGQAADVFNFIVQNDAGVSNFTINPAGKVGILQSYSNVGLNLRAVASDIKVFQIEDAAGGKLVSVSPNGHVGFNNSYTNIGFNIRGISGDLQTLNVESPTGVRLFSVSPTGRAGLNQTYTNVGMVIKGVSGDNTVFKIENSDGIDRLLVREAGQVGINAVSTQTTFTARSVQGDVFVMKLEDDAGTDLLTVNPTGHLGVNAAFSNVTTNIRQVANDAKILNIEDATGLDLLTVQNNATIIKDLSVTGMKSFFIDHPADPANKYLRHNCVEGPKPYNVYQGTIAFDANGEASVALPSYFESLNIDFVYQLSCVGEYAPIYIAEEINNNQFKIAGGKSGMKVSWVVTATRNDPYTRDHVGNEEIEKPANEKNTYLYPEGYGKSLKYSVGNIHEDKVMNE